jgi:hypothetical protein
MFERNIGHKAKQAREVTIRVAFGSNDAHTGVEGPGAEDGVYYYTGFLSGLDEGFVSLCRTDNQLVVIIDRFLRLVVEDTGRDLKTLKRKRLIPPEDHDRIWAACGSFIRTARAVYGSHDPGCPAIGQGGPCKCSLAQGSGAGGGSAGGRNTVL